MRLAKLNRVVLVAAISALVPLVVSTSASAQQYKQQPSSQQEDQRGQKKPMTEEEKKQQKADEKAQQKLQQQQQQQGRQQEQGQPQRQQQAQEQRGQQGQQQAQQQAAGAAAARPAARSAASTAARPAAGRSATSSRIWASSGKPFFGRVDDFPVGLHVHHRPALGLRFIERLVEAADGGLTVVGPFPPGIGVVHQQGKMSAFPGIGPLEHLQVAVGVAERGDRTAPDVLVDGNRLALLVVDEVDRRQAHQRRTPPISLYSTLMLLPMTCSGGMP